jgi:aryl-alcohol dehydrogenase-like predicted oxidoreductase
MPSLKLALGTAQFGLPYGVANRRGQVGSDEAAAILGRARDAGVDTLDTAIAYGDSERRLGHIGVGHWRVVTKLPAPSANDSDLARWAREATRGSLERLGIPRLYGLLLHKPRLLLGSQGEALQATLVSLKDEGLVEKIGVSVYGPEELDALWPHFRPDLVQGPLNVLDHRLRTSGWLQRMRDEGTEIHVRSVFLQGLLLMDAASRPPRFDRWEPIFERWHCWLTEAALSPVKACIGFALSHSEIARVVVGVDSLAQLDEVLGALHQPSLSLPPELVCNDLALLDPSRWPMQ